MDAQQHHQNIRGKVFDKAEEGKLNQEALPVTASPPSATSSPSHEFSFTISLHSSSAPASDNKSKGAPPSFAIDLTPADDIFFHGHLLPLHLLSHLPVSPRSSTNSLDSFTLPIRDLLDDQVANNSSSSSSSCCNDKSNHTHRISHQSETKGRSKAKSFSIFGWRKRSEVRDGEDDKEKTPQKKKLRFDVTHVLKRYARLVRPLFFFKGRRENLQFQRQPYTFSGNLSTRNKHELRGRRAQLSAPASMRTSPTNSGLLVATTTLPSSTSDSTMEELQAAIQAAIAHCKNSIAAEEKSTC